MPMFSYHANTKSFNDIGLPPAGSAVRQNFEIWDKINKHTSDAFRGDSQPGKWRLIVDLSSPVGASVNDGILMEWSSVSYVFIEHLLSLVLRMGKMALLVRADIKEAYRMLPLHAEDQALLGV